MSTEKEREREGGGGGERREEGWRERERERGGGGKTMRGGKRQIVLDRYGERERERERERIFKMDSYAFSYYFSFCFFNLYIVRFTLRLPRSVIGMTRPGKAKGGPRISRRISSRISCSRGGRLTSAPPGRLWLPPGLGETEGMSTDPLVVGSIPCTLLPRFHQVTIRNFTVGISSANRRSGSSKVISNMHS